MAPPRLQRITVAVDGSEFAQRALDLAADLAVRYSGALEIVAVAPLVPVYVASTEPWVPTEVPETEVARYRAVIDAAVASAEKAGVTSVTGLCLEGAIVDELLNHIDANPPDLLVLGSRGLSAAKRLLLGSVSDAVAHHVKCPVLLVKSPDVATKPRSRS